MLVGLLEPQAGQSEFNGKPLSRYTITERCRNIGLVMQNPADQIFGATVEEDVAYGPINLGLTDAEVKYAVSEALEAVGATHLVERPTHQLSFGEQKRVAIAGVLAMVPPVILLDEPTSGLDPIGEESLWKVLQHISRTQRVTVLVATHAIDLLPDYAHRALILHDGRLAKQGPVAEVLGDVEGLTEAGLRLPHVAELMLRLKRDDRMPADKLPLTVEKAHQQLIGLIVPGARATKPKVGK